MLNIAETFFYHYYCIVDKTTYDTPEGVYIYDAVKEQDVDAYCMVDVIDLSAMKNGMAKEDIYVPEEEIKDEMFPNVFTLSIIYQGYKSYSSRE